MSKLVIFVKTPTHSGLILVKTSKTSKTRNVAALWILNMILLCLKTRKSRFLLFLIKHGFGGFDEILSFAYGLCGCFDENLSLLTGFTDLPIKPRKTPTRTRPIIKQGD